MNEREQILSLLRTLNGRSINVCGEIYQILKEQNDSAQSLFEFFCENSEGIESSGETDAQLFFTEDEEAEYTDLYGKIVDGILEKLLKERPDKESFYKALWEKITLKELFEDEKAQIFAFYYIWIDKRIPYFELPADPQITEQEYKETIYQLRPKIQKARFILALDLEQWPQVSGPLVQLLDETEDQKERIVLLSCIMQLRESMLHSDAPREGQD